jgi:hypothetical protein
MGWKSAGQFPSGLLSGLDGVHFIPGLHPSMEGRGMPGDVVALC